MQDPLRFVFVACLICGRFLFAQSNRSSTEQQSVELPSETQRLTGQAYGNIDVLSDPDGVNFGPYLQPVLVQIRQHWYNLIPQAARAPIMKKGRVSVVFHILKDGNVADLKVEMSSGDVQLDRAAWDAITASMPLPPLPTEFSHQYVAIRMNFLYNPDKPGPWANPEVVSSKPLASVLRLDMGSVEGRTYKNASIGLEFTPAPKLKLQSPEAKGEPGTAPLLVSVNAWGGRSVFSVREGTRFYAEDLANYPADQRSTQAYMQGLVGSNRKDGFALVDASTDSNLGDASFARIDFKKGLVYQAVLVKTCEARGLVFIFTGSGRDAVNKLIAATGLKLNLATPGCIAEPEVPQN